MNRNFQKLVGLTVLKPAIILALVGGGVINGYINDSNISKYNETTKLAQYDNGYVSGITNDVYICTQEECEIVIPNTIETIPNEIKVIYYNKDKDFSNENFKIKLNDDIKTSSKYHYIKNNKGEITFNNSINNNVKLSPNKKEDIINKGLAYNIKLNKDNQYRDIKVVVYGTDNYKMTTWYKSLSTYLLSLGLAINLMGFIGTRRKYNDYFNDILNLKKDINSEKDYKKKYKSIINSMITQINFDARFLTSLSFFKRQPLILEDLKKLDLKMSKENSELFLAIFDQGTMLKDDNVIFEGFYNDEDTTKIKKTEVSTILVKEIINRFYSTTLLTKENYPIDYLLLLNKTHKNIKKEVVNSIINNTYMSSFESMNNFVVNILKFMNYEANNSNNILVIKNSDNKCLLEKITKNIINYKLKFGNEENELIKEELLKNYEHLLNLHFKVNKERSIEDIKLLKNLIDDEWRERSNITNNYNRANYSYNINIQFYEKINKLLDKYQNDLTNGIDNPSNIKFDNYNLTNDLNQKRKLYSKEESYNINVLDNIAENIPYTKDKIKELKVLINFFSDNNNYVDTSVKEQINLLINNSEKLNNIYKTMDSNMKNKIISSYSNILTETVSLLSTVKNEKETELLKEFDIHKKVLNMSSKNVS